jgi:hypothetical protein
MYTQTMCHDKRYIVHLQESLQLLHTTAHATHIYCTHYTICILVLYTQDPSSGMDCDISVMNPLAVRNTELLRAYSQADPRVRKVSAIYSSNSTASFHCIHRYCYVLQYQVVLLLTSCILVCTCL